MIFKRKNDHEVNDLLPHTDFLNQKRRRAKQNAFMVGVIAAAFICLLLWNACELI